MDLKIKIDNSILFNYKICTDCKRRIRESELHVYRPRWNDCEIIKDYQEPVTIKI